jgi:hypothetical protein
VLAVALAAGKARSYPRRKRSERRLQKAPTRQAMQSRCDA